MFYRVPNLLIFLCICDVVAGTELQDDVSTYESYWWVLFSTSSQCRLDFVW